MKTKTPPAKFGRLAAGALRTVGTLRIEFLADPGRRGPLTAMRVLMKPGGSHPPLWHERTAEFFVVLRGGMKARIAGRARRFSKGDYAYLPPGTPHEFHAGSGGVEVLSVFTPGLDRKNPDIVFR